MQAAIHHTTEAELENGLAEVLASPCEAGSLEAIFVRPAADKRASLTTAIVSAVDGLEGDRWASERGDRSSDEKHLQSQISIMNSRFLRQIAGDEQSMCLAGDNLIVDLDLSESNLPAGSRLQVGEEVVLEMTDLPHTGCSKLARRYGTEAKQFMNNAARKELHLRGRYAKTILGGTIRVGDRVRKQQQ
jgi:MOSC domain-containing protein YiiM